MLKKVVMKAIDVVAFPKKDGSVDTLKKTGNDCTYQDCSMIFCTAAYT